MMAPILQDPGAAGLAWAVMHAPPRAPVVVGPEHSARVHASARWWVWLQRLVGK
jgi:hypothetical protein